MHSVTNRYYSDFMQRIIDAIRAVDKNHIIVVDRALWMYTNEHLDQGTFYNTSHAGVYYPLLRDRNLVFDWHDYKLRPTRNVDGTITPGGTVEEMVFELEQVNQFFCNIYGGNMPIYIGEYSCQWDYNESDALFLQWITDMHAILDARGYSRNLHTYYGWNKGEGTYNSMALRYVTSWHADAMTKGTLYEPLAQIFREDNLGEGGNDSSGSSVQVYNGTVTTNADDPHTPVFVYCGFTPDVGTFAVEADYTEGGRAFSNNFTVDFSAVKTGMTQATIVTPCYEAHDGSMTRLCFYLTPAEEGFHLYSAGVLDLNQSYTYTD